MNACLHDFEVKNLTIENELKGIQIAGGGIA